MHSPTLLAAQIIKPPPDFTEVYAIPLACLGVIGIGVAVGVVCFFFEVDIAGPPAGLCIGLILAGLVFGAGSLPGAADKDKSRVDEAAMVDLIEETYRITAVDINAEDTPSAEGLCQPVTLDSPEFEGISDGQKVTFRIGVPDCDTPDPEIVITETTGRAVDANDLRRK